MKSPSTAPLCRRYKIHGILNIAMSKYGQCSLNGEIRAPMEPFIHNRKEGCIMTNEVIPMDQASALPGSMTLFLAGATVGAIAALLFAPQGGRETRAQLNEYGR